MKQRILILCTVFFTISLTAFGFINWKNAEPIIQTIPAGSGAYLVDFSFSSPVDFDFAYSVDTRFLATITKEKLDKAQSITEIISTKNCKSIESYHHIELSTFHENRKNQIREKGEDEVLNDAQIRLLRSMDYTTSFYVVGNVKRRDDISGRLVVDTLINYITVVPNKPAAYKEGKDALITYLKKNSKKAIAIAREDQLKPGKISFTVTKDGSIDQVRLTYTSGYTSIDEKMLELIWEIPGSWEVATNAKGEKVDQELVFFFGLIGC